MEKLNPIMGKFNELPYKRPDAKELKKNFAKHLNRFKSAKTFEEADSAFLDFMGSMESWSTQNTIASIRNTMNMKDDFYDKEMKFYNREGSVLMLTLKKAIKSILSSPFRAQFEEKYGSQMFKQYETQMKLIKLTTVLPTIREGNLSNEYSKTAAACSVEFMGEKCNFYGLLKHMQSTDRSERKAAFEEWAKLYEGASEKL